jgi:hypothetical protein
VWMLECDLERSGEWIPLCGHKTRERAESCMKYFQPMAAFSGKPMRVINSEAPGERGHSEGQSIATDSVLGTAAAPTVTH